MSFRIREVLSLLSGDVACFLVALLVTFLIRYQGESPELPFLVYAITWLVFLGSSLLSYFAAGLYDNQTRLLEGRTTLRLVNAQIGSAVLSIAFFYFFPLFGAAPKTLLVIYLVTSSVLVFVWRLSVRGVLFRPRKRSTLVIASGDDLRELVSEVNGNTRYPFAFDTAIDLSEGETDVLREKISDALKAPKLSFVVADLGTTRVTNLTSELYAQAPYGVSITDFSNIYEEAFGKVSLDLLRPALFVEEVFSVSHGLYDVVKRVMDIVLGLVLSVIGLILLPFVFLLVKADDGGSLFIPQVRIGERGKRVTVQKLRTMNENLVRSDAWVKEKGHVTRVGRALRRLSIDELPQVFSIFAGEMSLIGPRADIEGLGVRLSEEIPNYALRTLIKPGISGWAQTQQIYKRGSISPQSVEETRLRLAYDLYYIKHRSILLDIRIALRTVAIVLGRLVP